MAEKQRLEMTILGEPLRLRVEAREVGQLEQAASYLLGKIAAFQESGEGGNTRLAVLAGLEIAQELLTEREGESPQARERRKAAETVGRRIERLIDKVDKAMEE